MSGAEYQRLLELGRGGMGAAYLSRAVGAEGFERLVVAKRLLPHLMEHPDAVNRFLAEAKVAAVLHHSNIVGVHHAGKDADGYFIVYDYVEGAALDELVDRLSLRGARLPVPVALRIALDALTGLHAAHTARDNSGRALNILHRDISPENLLIGRDGVTRVLDFGIAKSAIASVTTDQNYLLGKLMFMAPEYLARRPVGPNLDVYALGVSLWFALTGASPWPDSSEAQLVMRITTEGLPALGSTGLAVPPAVEVLIARATAMDPAERFPDAGAMLDSIERLSRDTGWLASHREVAALVEQQCGVDLDRRRTHVSSLLSRRGLELADSASAKAASGEASVRSARVAAAGTESGSASLGGPAGAGGSASTESPAETAPFALTQAAFETQPVSLVLPRGNARQRKLRWAVAAGVTGVAGLILVAGVGARVLSPDAETPAVAAPQPPLEGSLAEVGSAAPAAPLEPPPPSATAASLAAPAPAGSVSPRVRPASPTPKPRQSAVSGSVPSGNGVKPAAGTSEGAPPVNVPESGSGITKTNPYRKP